MVGCPASGKSTVSHDFFHEKKGYVLVNQDTLGTASKCAKVGREEGGGGGGGGGGRRWMGTADGPVNSPECCSTHLFRPSSRLGRARCPCQEAKRRH